MQLLKITALSIMLSGALLHSVQAATDHNSSRSNKTSSVAAPDVTDEMLRKAQQDASIISKSMLQVDQSDGYQGDYEITVDVRVSIERSPRPGNGKIIIKDVGKR